MWKKVLFQWFEWIQSKYCRCNIKEHFKTSCANPTPNEYSNIWNKKNQTLAQKLLHHSVGLKQLSQLGISNQTANALGKCAFPEDGWFKKEIPQTVQQYRIDKRFEDLKEISTAGRIRRLEPKWTELLNEFLHPLNYYCIWTFKKHYLRKSASRKSSPYFRCDATCKVEECNCKVKIRVNEKSDRFGKSVFIGNVNHKTGALAFRQIKGEKRSLEK